jgi:DNA-binding NtrC family response regulator
VDDNEALVGWVAGFLGEAGCRVLRAGSVKEAEAWIAGHEVHAAFIDQLLPDGDGVQLAVRLHSRTPTVFSILMTGGHVSDEARALCRRFAVPVLIKPFPGAEMLTLIDTGERAAANSAR